MIQLSIVSNPSFFALKNLAVFYRTFPDICLGQVWALLWCIGGHRNNKLSCFLFGFPYVMSGISHLLISVSLFCVSIYFIFMPDFFFLVSFLFFLSLLQLKVSEGEVWSLYKWALERGLWILGKLHSSSYSLSVIFLHRSNYVFHWV